MRFFLNLSVGRKLAASAALALLMIGALVTVTRDHSATLAEERERLRRANAAEATLKEALAAAALGRAAVRDALHAQSPAELDGASESARAAMAEVRRLVEAATAQAGQPATRDAARAVLPAAEAWDAAFAEVARHRRTLLERRDGRFFPLSSEYEMGVEGAVGALEFDVPAEQREEARARWQTFHTAVSETRIALQAYLATGAATQVQRTRRSMTLVRVHLRGVQGAAGASGPAADTFRRLGETALGLAAAAEEMLAAEQAMLAAWREGVTPARERMEAALRAAAAALDGEAGAIRAALAEAADSLDRAVLVAGGGIVLLLQLSAVLTARAVGAPLRRLAEVIGRIAQGDTAVEVPDRGRRDEIGRIAEALEALRGKVGRAFARGQMLEQLPIGVTTADPREGLRITYLNAEARRILERIEHALPCRADEVEGRGIEAILPGEAARLHALLADPAGLPHRERVRIGAETLDMSASAIRDGAGGYVGAMLAWSVATEQARLADTFEREVGGVVEAVAASAAQVQAAAQALSHAAETSGGEAAAVADASGRASAEVQAVAAAAEEASILASAVVRGRSGSPYESPAFSTLSTASHPQSSIAVRQQPSLDWGTDAGTGPASPDRRMASGRCHARRRD